MKTEYRSANVESRTSRFNLPVSHPSRWRLLVEQLLAPSIRIQRMRNLSARLFEDAVDDIDGRAC
ncbi:MAG: hypothetical protein QNJ00_06890 [Woeseiaceae bacterium]|nr:hypothetical protein [Woeseiaceae bacterium]